MLGRETEVKLLQPWKARSPIEVTPSGIEIEVKLLQPEKAELSMVVNELFSFTIKVLSSVHPLNVESSIVLI